MSSLVNCPGKASLLPRQNSKSPVERRKANRREMEQMTSVLQDSSPLGHLESEPMAHHISPTTTRPSSSGARCRLLRSGCLGIAKSAATPSECACALPSAQPYGALLFWGTDAMECVSDWNQLEDSRTEYLPFLYWKVSSKMCLLQQVCPLYRLKKPPRERSCPK